jgi:hypothetical protein
LGGLVAAALAAAACSSSDPPDVKLPDVGPGATDASTVGPDGGPAPGDGGVDPAGDGGAGEARLYSGGTRLRARFHRTSDGTFAFIGWNDSQIGIDCRFAVSSDGRLRCVPSTPLAYVYTSPGYFKDASCTQRIAVHGTGPCAATPRYASMDDRTVCPERTRIYALGAKLATTTAYYRDAGGGPCQQTTWSGADLYDVGAEVAATAFVAATEQTGPDLGGVARADLTADDGARGFSRFVDVARAQTCYFRDATDGSLRCLPSGDAYVSTSTFANASCTIPAASRSATACPAPTTAQSSTPQGCSYVTRVFSVGASAPTPYYQGASCTSFNGGSSQYFAAGAEIAPTSFADARVVPPSGGARVQAKQLLLRGGEPYPFGLRDTQRNEDCYFMNAGDGTSRCLPSAGAQVYFYTDAQCTQRIASRYTGGGCATPPTLAQQYDDSTCPARTRLFAVGSPIAPGTLYVKTTSGCLQTSTSSTTFYALGAEVPASSFVSSTIVDR